MLLEGFTAYDATDAERYTRLRWWSGLTFGDVLDKAADVYPGKEAIVDDSGRYTYAQIREKADRLAIGLYHLGLRPLDRVLAAAFQLAASLLWPIFALQKIGAVPVVLIARYRQYEIDHLAPHIRRNRLDCRRTFQKNRLSSHHRRRVARSPADRLDPSVPAGTTPALPGPE